MASPPVSRCRPAAAPSYGWLSGDFAHGNNEARHHVEHLKSQQNWENPRLANSNIYPDAQQENHRSLDRTACTSELPATSVLCTLVSPISFRKLGHGVEFFSANRADGNRQLLVKRVEREDYVGFETLKNEIVVFRGRKKRHIT
jgi:hypothetical protein